MSNEMIYVQRPLREFARALKRNATLQPIVLQSKELYKPWIEVSQILKITF